MASSATLSIPTFYTSGSSWQVSLNGTCKVTVDRTYGNSYITVSADWAITSPGGMTSDVIAYLTVGSMTKSVTFTGTKTAGASYSKSASFTVSVGDSAGTVTASAYLYVNDTAATSGKTSSTVTASVSYDSKGNSVFKSVPTFTLGESGTITLTRYSSDFTHTITCKVGSRTETICSKSSATSVSWTPSATDWISYVGSSATATYTLTTYSGSTQVGSAVTTTGTIKAPSASVFNSVPTFTLGSSGTIKVTRYCSSYTHTITVTVGSYTETICTKSSSTSVSWKPALSASTIAGQITTSSTGTATYKMTTYCGSTTVGSTVTTTGTVKVPSSPPTINSVTLSGSSNGLWIQDNSVMQAAITATAQYGATVKSYGFALTDGTLSASGTSSPLKLSSALPNSGTVEYRVAVKDSRGTTTSQKGTIEVAKYWEPYITAAIEVKGTTLNVVYKFSAAPLMSDNQGYNTIDIHATVTRASDGAQVGFANLTPDYGAEEEYSGSGVYSLTLADLQYETYKVDLQIADMFHTVTQTYSTGQIALSFRAGGTRASFFGQWLDDGNFSDAENVVEILGNPNGEGSVGVIAKDPDTGLVVATYIGAGRKNHGIISNGYVTDANLAAGKHTDDSAWLIHRNSSGYIQVGDSSHPCYASGGFVSGGHDSAIGTELYVTGSSMTVKDMTATSLCSLTIGSGTWVVVGTVYMTASSVSGSMACNLNSTSGTTSGNTTYRGASAWAAKNEDTTIKTTVIGVPTTDGFTYYLNGWQDTGESQTMRGYIRAVRIA